MRHTFGGRFQSLKYYIIHLIRKSKLRDYTVRVETLSTVDTATYLEVKLSMDLMWNKQMEKVAQKNPTTFNVVRRTVTTSSFEAKGIIHLQDPGMPTDGIWCLHFRPPHIAIDKKPESGQCWGTH